MTLAQKSKRYSAIQHLLQLNLPFLPPLTLHLQNARYKQFGFELVTEDDRIFYPLAAESDEELEDWISILNRAIHMEVEETDLGREMWMVDVCAL